jgi:hypothetical protein
LAHADMAEEGSRRVKAGSVDYLTIPYQRAQGRSPDLVKTGSRLTLHEVATTVSFGMPVGDLDTLLLASLSYRVVHLGFVGPEAPRLHESSPTLPAGAAWAPTMHEAHLFLAVVQPLWEDFSVFVNLSPGYAAATHSVGAAGLDVSARALLYWQPLPALKLGLGAVLMYRLGDPWFLPAFLVDWRIRDDLHLYVLPPRDLHLTYSLHEQVSLTLHSGISGASFWVSGEARASTAALSVPYDYKLRYYHFLLGAIARGCLAGGFCVGLEAGLVTAPHWEHGDACLVGRDDARACVRAPSTFAFYNLTPDLSWYVRLRLEYYLTLDP